MRPMRARALIVGVVLLALVGPPALDAAATDEALFRALNLTRVVNAPPPLALQRLEDRRTLTLGDLRGRPVLVYFWATW